VIVFLTKKWEVELDYKLKKELWALPKTELLYVLNTNITTMPASGFVLIATKTGNLTNTA